MSSIPISLPCHNTLPSPYAPADLPREESNVGSISSVLSGGTIRGSLPNSGINQVPSSTAPGATGQLIFIVPRFWNPITSLYPGGPLLTPNFLNSSSACLLCSSVLGFHSWSTPAFSSFMTFSARPILSLALSCPVSSFPGNPNVSPGLSRCTYVVPPATNTCTGNVSSTSFSAPNGSGNVRSPSSTTSFSIFIPSNNPVGATGLSSPRALLQACIYFSSIIAQCNASFSCSGACDSIRLANSRSYNPNKNISFTNLYCSSWVFSGYCLPTCCRRA